MSRGDDPSDGPLILRHEQRAPAPDAVAHADDERIGDHLERSLGGHGMVFHEIVSDRLHLDVHMVAPTEQRPFYVLVTSGMSALPMTMPAQMENPEQWSLLELAILLPPDWKLEQAALSDERNYWPIRLLKTLARLPHEFNTWLGWGHSVPNGDPARPYAPETELAGALVIPPFMLGAPFFEVEGEPPLHVMQVLPVTAAEMAFKLESGVDALLERLEADEGIYGPVNPRRASLV